MLVCTAKRCVAKKSKTTGKRVLVCAKPSVIRFLSAKRRIRSGFSLPVVVPAANAPVRITLSRKTKVVLRFARRSGKRYVSVPGTVKLALQRGKHGRPLRRAGLQEAVADTWSVPPRGHRAHREGRAVADGAAHVHAAQVAAPQRLDIRPSRLLGIVNLPVGRTFEPLPPRA